MGQKPLSKDLAEQAVDAVKQAIADGYPLNAIPGKLGAVTVAADNLKENRGTIRSRLKVAEHLYGLTPDGITSTGTDPRDAEIIRLKDELRDRNAQLTNLHRENLSAERVREFVTSVKSTLPDPPDWTLTETAIGDPGVPLALWSDWHVGEVVFRDQVGGVNEFNIEIAQRRVRRLVQRIIEICFQYTVNPSYPGIVVCLGGDMISGIIHEELTETMEGPLSDQIRETYRLLVWALKQLADKFGAVFVVAVVGNHGRLHHKPRAKNRVQDSFEYMIYHFLADKFDDDERINFFIPDQTDAWFEVAGHRFLLTHGDSTGARGGDGIIGAIGPIVRGEKKVRDVAGFTGDAYDVALMGHYHISVSLDNVIVNPTLKGYDEFARNVLRARPERPAQTLIFIHPEKGIIDERRIWLEDKPERRPVSDFVAIPGAP